MGATSNLARLSIDDAESGADASQQCSSRLDNELESLAGPFVHLLQAVAQLFYLYPNQTPSELAWLYARKLLELHGLNDPRIPMALDQNLRILFTKHGIIDGVTHIQQKRVRGTIESLPAVQKLVIQKGELTTKPDRVLVERALSGIPLPGYEFVRPVRGLTLRADSDVIEIVKPDGGPPIGLLRDGLMPKHQALGHVIRDLPGLNSQLLDAALCAAICADSGRGKPPMLFVVGPTGSGKDQIPRLAASFLDDDVQQISISGEEEPFCRRLAGYSDTGRRFVQVSEVARKPNLLKLLLAMTNKITWRAHHQNRDVQSSNRCAYFLVGINVPMVYRRSAEMRRRARLVRLARSVPKAWEQSLAERYGHEVDITEWRALSDLNTLTANSLLTHAYLLCQEHAFVFDAVADALGLGQIDEGDTELTREFCVALYRHCRGESAGRAMHCAPRWRVSWVDLRSPRCWEIVRELALGGEESLTKGKGLDELLYLLESFSWNDILKIRLPSIQCQTARHGQQCAIRFRDAAWQKKGDGVFNEHLPPVGEGVGQGPTASGNR